MQHYRPAAPTSADRYGLSGIWLSRRRIQKTRLTWATMNRLVARWLPPTRIMHPFPEARFAATHPR